MNIRVSSSLANTHVFPSYVPDKLLNYEITYKTIGNGIFKVMNFKRATIEMNSILELNFLLSLIDRTILMELSRRLLHRKAPLNSLMS